jgi:predicted esterase
MPRTALLLLGFVLISACSTASEKAHSVADQAGLKSELVHTDQFDLQTFHRFFPGSDVLRVYLEGDGQAWVNSTTPSDDPTPLVPLTLQLAAKDDTVSVAYVARPCQFTGGTAARRCSDRRYWTTARYSLQVLESTAVAIEWLLAKSGASELELVGYSGGGTIALLLSQRGIGAGKIVTIASPIDTAAWTSHHNVSTLDLSLNPARDGVYPNATQIVHFVGTEDRIVPVELTRNAIAQSSHDNGNQVFLREFTGFDHHCCWLEIWPGALQE